MKTGAGNTMKTGRDFALEQQQQQAWCWAAIIKSLLDHYCICHGHTQATIVQKYTGSIPPDAYGVLERPMKDTGIFSYKLNGAASVQRLVQELTAGNIVCVRILWNEGGGHFAAIYDCVADDAGLQLYIADPWYGPAMIEYSDFPAGYRDGGHWTHTYFTRRPG